MTSQFVIYLFFHENFVVDTHWKRLDELMVMWKIQKKIDIIWLEI